MTSLGGNLETVIRCEWQSSNSADLSQPRLTTSTISVCESIDMYKLSHANESNNIKNYKDLMSGYEQDGLAIIGPYKQLVKKGDAVTC